MGETRVGVGSASNGVGEGKGSGETVGNGLGVLGVLVAVGKGTMVGVDEAPVVPFKVASQSLKTITLMWPVMILFS